MSRKRRLITTVILIIIVVICSTCADRVHRKNAIIIYPADDHGIDWVRWYGE